MTFITATSLADPPLDRPLNTAVNWVEAVLQSDLAVALAAIAIAGIGFAMLAGRVELRRGLSVLVGCFLLFGASAIAQSLTGLDSGPQFIASGSSAPPPVALPPPVPPGSEQPSYFDPYAGASATTQ